MDDITVPRQSVHPSQLRPNSRTRRRSSEQAPEIPLAEYVTAMAVEVPQLKLYTRVSKDLQAWIAQSKVVYDQAEEEAAKLTPELFTEYSQADEEGQEQLLVGCFLFENIENGTNGYTEIEYVFLVYNAMYKGIDDAKDQVESGSSNFGGARFRMLKVGVHLISFLH